MNAMLGVVLWNDPEAEKAVIWCEDHGQLAFFKGELDETAQKVELNVGDLVSFEMIEDAHLRYAHDLRTLSAQEYPDIANCLTSTEAQDTPETDALDEDEDDDTNVVKIDPSIFGDKKWAVA